MLISKHSAYDVDQLARNLASMALQASMMPPAFASHGISEPIIAPRAPVGASRHSRLGRILDGKGIYLDADLKDFGIHKPIPHVYERTPLRRIFDVVGDEVGAITTYDGIIAARGAGNYYDPLWGKLSTTTVANQWTSLYRTAGTPAAGAYTTTPGATKDSTDAGSLLLGFPAPGSNSAYLLSIGMMAAQQINWLAVCDLLCAVGSIIVTSASSQTVSSAALTRYTTGAGVWMSFEVTTALGTGAASITATYTNQAGTGSRSTGTQLMTPSAIVQRMVPITIGLPTQLQSGDSGVRAVASTIMSATMTAGAVALNLFKPLAFIPGLVANVYGEKDTTITIDSLVPLVVDSGTSNCGCPVAYVMPNTTSTGIMSLVLRGVYG